MRLKELWPSLTIGVSWLLVITGFLWLYSTDKQAQATAKSDETSAIVIRAQLSHETRPINPEMLCYNTNVLYDPPWINREFQNLVDQLHLGSLRIPGGTVSAYWDWKNRELYPNSHWRDDDSLANDLTTYQAGFAATGTTPVFVLNMLTAPLADQLEMLREASALGMPVKYIELGNEYYLPELDSDYVHTYPTGADYADAAEIWSDAIQEEFPQAQIAVVGAPPWPKASVRLGQWNDALIPLTTDKDLRMAFHPYTEVGLQKKDVFRAADIPRVLGMPFLTWQAYQSRNETPTLSKLPAEARIWLTEYNSFENPKRKSLVGGRWAQGLLVTTQSLLFIEEKRVDLMCVQLLIGPSQWAAATSSDSADNFTLTASGLAVQLLGQAITGKTSAERINFSEPPIAHGLRDEEYPTLLGGLFSDDTGHQTAIVVNLSAEASHLLFEPAVDFPDQYQQRFGKPKQKIFGYEGIDEITGKIENGILVLQPYSVTYLSNKK